MAVASVDVALVTHNMPGGVDWQVPAYYSPPVLIGVSYYMQFLYPSIQTKYRCCFDNPSPPQIAVLYRTAF